MIWKRWARPCAKRFIVSRGVLLSWEIKRLGRFADGQIVEPFQP